MCGLERSPDKSLIVVCGDEVVVVAMRNVAATIDVVAVDGVVVAVGDVAAVVVWVQRCLMRPCTSPQFAFMLVVVTPTGKELSWWDR